MSAETSKEPIIHQGFTYIANRTTKNVQYLVCNQQRRKGCKGRAYIKSDGELVLKQNHNHAPDPEVEIVKLFKSALRDAVLRETDSINTVYRNIRLLAMRKKSQVGTGNTLPTLPTIDSMKMETSDCNIRIKEEIDYDEIPEFPNTAIKDEVPNCDFELEFVKVEMDSEPLTELQENSSAPNLENCCRPLTELQENSRAPNLENYCRPLTELQENSSAPTSENYRLICNEEFGTESLLLEHKNVCENNKTNKKICDLCGKSFEGDVSLQRHMKAHLVLSEHIKLKQRLEPYRCKTCHLCFIDVKSLNKHAISHENKKIHKCAICNNHYSTVWYLKQHLTKHCNYVPVPCTICNKSFVSTSSLQMHLLTHCELKPHKCTGCRLSFSTLSQLKQHSINHKDVKPFKCKTCNMGFKREVHLQSHIKIHRGLRPHQCTECSKSFITLHNLEEHLLTHDKVNPYACNQCNMRFASDTSRRIHLFTHTNVKKYKCGQCDKVFLNSADAISHMEVHRGNECEYCNMVFTRMTSLKRHKITQHASQE